MTYPQLALAFIAAAVVVGLALPLVQRRRPRTWPRWGAVVITVVVLVILTTIFDSIMIAAGLFHYAPDALAGLHEIGRASCRERVGGTVGATCVAAREREINSPASY